MKKIITIVMEHAPVICHNQTAKLKFEVCVNFVIPTMKNTVESQDKM